MTEKSSKGAILEESGLWIGNVIQSQLYLGVLWTHSLEEELPMAGKLIVLEGTDGCGKSTQFARLRAHLEAVSYTHLDVYKRQVQKSFIHCGGYRLRHLVQLAVKLRCV